MRDTRRLQIGISGSYGGWNLGDEAILDSILTQLDPGLRERATIFTRDAEDTRGRHPQARVVAVREMAREEARAEIERLDLLVLGGGGILYDSEAETFLREVALAHEAGVPVMVYAISAGPLQEPGNRKLVAKHLNRAAAVTVRDRQALKLLESVGVEREIVLTADPALLLEPESMDSDPLPTDGVEPGRPLVGFSVREPGPAAPDIDVEHYHGLLAATADFMVARLDAHVVFIPMERKKSDLQQSHAVVSRMQHPQHATVLKGEYGPRQVLSLVGRFRFCVGMRLHFLIFAALQHVPFVALPYASKILGFLQDLEMPTPPLEEVTVGGLIAHVDRAWDGQEALREQIRRQLPALQERARESHRILTALLEDAGGGRAGSGA